MCFPQSFVASQLPLCSLPTRAFLLLCSIALVERGRAIKSSPSTNKFASVDDLWHLKSHDSIYCFFMPQML